MVECLRTVRSYFRKFLVDVNLKNGGFIIISAVDFLFLFWSQNWESQKDYWFVCCILGGCVPLKGTVEKQTFYFVKVFCSLQVLIKKKKKPKLVELEVPLLLSPPSEPFSKPTSLKMTFIDFHSMRVILQNEDGGVRDRNLPCVTCGIGVPPYLVLFYLFCFLYPETCTLGIIRSSVSWSELEYSILIDQFMCSFIQQTFIEQSCPRHWRY